MEDEVGTQEQDPQRPGVWCPVLSHGHDVCVRSWRAWLYICEDFLFGEAEEENSE